MSWARCKVRRVRHVHGVGTMVEVGHSVRRMCGDSIKGCASLVLHSPQDLPRIYMGYAALPALHAGVARGFSLALRIQATENRGRSWQK